MLDNLAQHLRDPRAIERFLLTYRAERKRLAATEADLRAQAEKRLGEVRREMERYLNSMIKGLVPAEEIGPHITALSEERKHLEAELTRAGDTIIALHPDGPHPLPCRGRRTSPRRSPFGPPRRCQTRAPRHCGT